MTANGFPGPMSPSAFVGPIGNAVCELEAEVEACREALLAELLVFFGNAVGRTAYMQIGRTRHYANLFVALLGQSSRARKGTVRDVAVGVVSCADASWADHGILGGATSGEGIIAAVRDPLKRRRKATEKERKDMDLTFEIDSEGYIIEEVDPGVEDKRVTFDEAELSSVFKVAGRDGSTLSERFRKMFDSGTDQIVNKNTPLKATNAHVSLNGHSTAEEIKARLTELDAANGWGNRFAYIATRRNRRLPGHEISDARLLYLAAPLAQAISWAREHEPKMTWAPEAWERWCAWYNAIEDDVRGLVGALTSRAEAHVMRFALTLAVADQTSSIRLEHLEAALAIWDYGAATVEWVWGGASGNPIADEILRHFQVAKAAGLSRTAIRDLFSRDRKAADLDAALVWLEDHDLAAWRTVQTGGRPATWWWAREFFPDPQGGTERDRNDQSPPFGRFRPVGSRPGGHQEKDQSPDF
jgi:hypothetical protein